MPDSRSALALIFMRNGLIRKASIASSETRRIRRLNVSVERILTGAFDALSALNGSCRQAFVVQKATAMCRRPSNTLRSAMLTDRFWPRLPNTSRFSWRAMPVERNRIAGELAEALGVQGAVDSRFRRRRVPPFIRKPSFETAQCASLDAWSGGEHLKCLDRTGASMRISVEATMFCRFSLDVYRTRIGGYSIGSQSRDCFSV